MGQLYKCRICGDNFNTVSDLHKHIESDRDGIHRKRSSR